MSIKKIIGILSIFLITGIAFTTLNASAHKPMHLDFNYDTDQDDSINYLVDETMVVTIIHGVTDRFYHYVYNITIFVNHTWVKTYIFTYQDTTNINNYIITGISAGSEAIIEVIAWCTLEGSYSKEFNIEGEPGEPKGSFSSIIVPTIMSTILVAIIVILPGISQKLKKRK